MDEPLKAESLSIRTGLGSSKSHSFAPGEWPAIRYNEQLMMAMPHDNVQTARNVKPTVIPLDQASPGIRRL